MVENENGAGRCVSEIFLERERQYLSPYAFLQQIPADAIIRMKNASTAQNYSVTVIG